MKMTEKYQIKPINLKNLLPAFATLIILACNNYTANDQTNKSALRNDTLLMYNLQQPDRKIKLPFELNEISALSYYNDNQLVCVQDEKADVYLVDFKTESVTEKVKSSIFGDYEGVEYVKGNIWLIRNDGELTEIENPGNSKESKNIYELDKITAKNNVEGLGYDPKSNSLLLAFKAKAHLKKAKKLENTRAIYRFDLKSKKLIKKPFLTIDLKVIKEKYGLNNFMPSGIAHHPIEDKFYITSSVNNGLVVLSRKSKILHVEKLKNSIFRQPEGICFSPDGETLFISNEGRNKKGNILVFNKIKQ